jgi:hypothetical protein
MSFKDDVKEVIHAYDARAYPESIWLVHSLDSKHAN